MPRGGARVGSGPKTGKPKAFAPTVIDGGRAGDVPSRAPEDLPASQHAFWNTYAPAAIAAQTLTDQTVGAFRLLCELDDEKRQTKETIDRDGRTFIKCTVDGAGNEHQELKAHPLTGSYRQLAQRVETMMGRFGLAPFGKPVANAKPRKSATDANPWARIVGQK